MKKITLITSALLLSLSTLSMVCAETISIQRITISGNKRIESDTILSYIRIKPGQTATDDDVNQALKELFATGFFNDVKVSVEGDNLVVSVEENPIINRIAYEGNSKLKEEQLKEEIQLRPREVLSRTKIQAAQQRILEMYRAMGRFAATVEPKIIQLDDNRCDVVFEIHEGETTYVRKINFIGNKHYSQSKLKDALITKEYRWFRFFLRMMTPLILCVLMQINRVCANTIMITVILTISK